MLDQTLPSTVPVLMPVGHRVDALVIAFAVIPDHKRIEYLLANVEEARDRGCAVIEFRDAGLAFEVSASAKSVRFSFANLDVRCMWDEQATGGWQLTVTPCATYLATHTVDETLELCRRIAGCLGLIQAERLRRVDLCADFQGFPLVEMGAEALQTRRSKTVSFQSEEKDLIGAPKIEPNEHGEAVRVFRKTDTEVTGYCVSPGNTIMARLYDKTVELRHPGREHKAELEHSIWRKNGWDGASQVTRVEFQLRGEILDEVELRDPSQLRDKLDAVWQYCTRWLRCIDVNSSTRRKRCAVLPAWKLVQETKFVHTAQPVERKRCRGGATVENMFGTLISYLGKTGRLRNFFHGSVDSFLDALDFEALPELEATLEELFREASRAYVKEMVNKHGWREAAARAFLKIQSCYVRFLESDDAQHFGDDEFVFDSNSVKPGHPIRMPSGELFHPITYDRAFWMQRAEEARA